MFWGHYKCTIFKYNQHFHASGLLGKRCWTCQHLQCTGGAIEVDRPTSSVALSISPSLSLRLDLITFSNLAIQCKGPDGKWIRKSLAYRESNILIIRSSWIAVSILKAVAPSSRSAMSRFCRPLDLFICNLCRRAHFTRLIDISRRDFSTRRPSHSNRMVDRSHWRSH